MRFSNQRKFYSILFVVVIGSIIIIAAGVYHYALYSNKELSWFKKAFIPEVYFENRQSQIENKIDTVQQILQDQRAAFEDDLEMFQKIDFAADEDALSKQNKSEAEDAGSTNTNFFKKIQEEAELEAEEAERKLRMFEK